jgi:hypothetical protein
MHNPLYNPLNFDPQKTSSSIELETRGAGNSTRGTGRRGGRRQQQQARLNKRHLSGEEVETVVSKRACPELPSVGWEHHTAIDPPMPSPAHSVSSNDTDFSSLALDSSEPEDQNSGMFKCGLIFFSVFLTFILVVSSTHQPIIKKCTNTPAACSSGVIF